MRTKLVLDKRKKNKNGYPVKIYFKFKEKAVYLLTGIEVELSEFENQEIIKRKDAAKLNKAIEIKKAKIDLALFDLETKNLLYTFTPESLKLELEGKNVVTSRNDLLFKPYFLDYGNKLKGKGTYKDTISKLAKHVDIDSLKFSDINRVWLKNMEMLMCSDGLSVNTIGIYFRNIRAVFNDAINNELIDFAIYPFRRFSIKAEDTAPRSMSVEQLRSFRNCKCTKAQEKYKDLFMLSFYLRGLNLKDLVFLKHEDIYNGTLYIKRAKTAVPLEIKIEPEAKEIIDKYKGTNYLLNVMDFRSNYHNFHHYFNKIIKSIGIEKENEKIIKQPFKQLSIYWARHSWATFAGELDIPDKIISIGLGHKEKQTIVDVYIKRNINKVHAANRKVIDFLFEI